jgi:site-specific DNA-methyltransferase (adenine-specific)
MKRNEIICGDAARVLRGFPGECIDLVVTSPPYGNIRDYEGYNFNFEAIAQQLARVLKPGGVIVWVEGDQVINGSESGDSFRHALYFKELGLRLHDTMIYEKDGAPFPDKTRYLNLFEFMFVLSKGKPKAINLLEEKKFPRDKSKKMASITGGHGKRPMTVRKDVTLNAFAPKSNIWRIKSGFCCTTKDNVWEHPAMFPEALAADHIKSWSNPGDLVLDPMCGSGTTLKAAQLLGRDYIGIDISEKYCDIARRRCSSFFKFEAK